MQWQEGEGVQELAEEMKADSGADRTGHRLLRHDVQHLTLR